MMIKRSIAFLFVFFSLCTSSGWADTGDEVADLLLEEIADAQAGNDIARLQESLAALTEVRSELPAEMDEMLQMLAQVEEDQLESYEMWLVLATEGQTLIEAGDFEAAVATIEEAFIVAQESFGPEHWITISTARDLGYAARQMGDAETADTFYGEAYGMAMETLGEAHPETQQIAALIVELYSAAGAPEEALSLQGMIVDNFESVLGPLHSLTLDAMVSQAGILEAASDFTSAIELLTVVCGRFDAGFSQYHPYSLDCEGYLANLHRNAGSLDEAERGLRTIVARLNESTAGINDQAIGYLIQLADILQLRGDYSNARALLSGLILTAKQIDAIDSSYTGRVYLARVLTAEGDFEAAEQLTRDVLSYGESAWSNDPIQYYNVLLELGGLYQRQGRLADAEAVFEEATTALLGIAGELHPSTLVAMNNLGNVYEQMGLYNEAEPVLKQALEGMVASLGVRHAQTARTRNNLALLHESQGSFREAEPLYLTSYTHIVDEFGENHPEAIAMQNNLAFLYMIMEDYDSSVAMFEDLVERWAVSVGADHQDALKTRNNLGRVYRRQGRLDEAEVVIGETLQMRKATLGEKHLDVIRSMIDLGVVYIDQARYEEAKQQLASALSLAEEVLGEQHPYTFDALNALARVTESLGDLQGAVDLRETGLARRSVFLDRMLWVTGENAREGYIRLHRPEVDAYLSLLTRVEDPEAGKKALDASLQRKGLLLKITSEIEQIAQLSQDPALAAISARLEQARKDLAALTLSGPTAETQGRHAEALYELELQVNELQGELGRASARYRSSIAGIGADSLEATVPEDATLVDFLTYSEDGEGRLLAGVLVNEGGEIRYELVQYPDRDAIEAAVLEYREIIQDDLADEDEVLEIGQYAYDLVWAPVRDVIGDLEYVYLIPDGVLNILPFNALMTEDEEYLIQTTDIHMLTSGRDLLPNEYQLADGEYLILAGPDYNSEQIVGEAELAAAASRRSAALKLGLRGAGGGLRGLNFAPLPGAEEEGRIITDRVNANEEASEVFFGEQAQEQVLAQIDEAPEILHMATHGFFLEADDTLRKRLLKMQRSTEIQVPPPGDNPLLRSGLAFAGINSNAQFLGDIDTVNDGVLTALEVLGLDLSGTRLVVLSACETGLGEIHEGEGVYGLRRSFQEAGVAEVISSLWEVSDAGTQALMTDFYERILEGQGAREALRDTQLAMLDSPEWGYPYIWSAFMIVGSYESAGMTIQ